MVHEVARTPRARRHDGNQRRILDTAMDMVEREGVAALSLHKLAAAVDYTPGALYRYFGSKDALFAQLVLQAIEDVRRQQLEARALLPEGASRFASVLASVHGYRAFARRTPQRFGLLATTLAEPRVLVAEDTVAQPIVVNMMATLRDVATTLADAASAGELAAGDADARTLCLFALAQGVLQMEKQARRAAGLIDTGSLLLAGARALLVGWGGAPAAVDQAIVEAEVVARGLGLAPPNTAVAEVKSSKSDAVRRSR